MFVSQLGAEEASTAVVPASQASNLPVPLYSVNPLYLAGGIVAAYLLYQYFYGEE